MALQPIGIVIFLIGVMCVVFGRRLAILAFFPVTLLGASAAAFLPLLGNANLQPAHFLLAFLAADLLLRPRLLQIGLTSLAINRAGFWLLLTVVYGVAAAMLMPRIFAGAAHVFNIAQQGSGGAGVIQVPLAPTSANVTQSLYFIGDLICFTIFFAYASDRRGVDSVARAVIACAFVNLGFATVDVASHFGTTDLMSLVRNANYRIMGDIEIAGFKRIVGSFAEASSFSYATLMLFAFTRGSMDERCLPGDCGIGRSPISDRIGIRDINDRIFRTNRVLVDSLRLHAVRTAAWKCDKKLLCLSDLRANLFGCCRVVHNIESVDAAGNTTAHRSDCVEQV